MNDLIYYDTQPLSKAAPSNKGGIHYKEENKTEYIPHGEVLDFVLMSFAGWLNYFKTSKLPPNPIPHYQNIEIA